MLWAPSEHLSVQLSILGTMQASGLHFEACLDVRAALATHAACYDQGHVEDDARAATDLRRYSFASRLVQQPMVRWYEAGMG